MAMARWQASITDDQGNVVPGAMVEVRREDSGGLTQLYSDREGAVAKGNPFAVDGEGFAFFHAYGGAYRVRAYADGFERVWRYVAVGLGAESDLTMAAPAGGWDAGATYAAGSYVFYSGYIFISRTYGNHGNEPDAATPGDTLEWMFAGAAVAGPPGEITGPGGSTDGNAVVFDGSTGTRVRDAGFAPVSAGKSIALTMVFGG